MNYIEFIGPPGVGKSSIHSKLIEVDRFFGGIIQDATRRLLLEKINPTYGIVYRLLPTVVQSFLEDEFLEYRLENWAIKQFLRSHPDFIRVLSDAMTAAAAEPEQIFSMCMQKATRFQLAKSTLTRDEILCLESSCLQKSMSILWRAPTFPIENYLKTIPEPDLLVHIDAPPEVCLSRQRERGRVTVVKEWEKRDPLEVQQQLREICFTVKDHLSTQTMTIENTQTIESAAVKITDEISMHLRASPSPIK